MSIKNEVEDSLEIILLSWGWNSSQIEEYGTKLRDLFGEQNLIIPLGMLTNPKYKFEDAIVCGLINFLSVPNDEEGMIYVKLDTNKLLPLLNVNPQIGRKSLRKILRESSMEPGYKLSWDEEDEIFYIKAASDLDSDEKERRAKKKLGIID